MQKSKRERNNKDVANNEVQVELFRKWATQNA